MSPQSEELAVGKGYEVRRCYLELQTPHSCADIDVRKVCD